MGKHHEGNGNGGLLGILGGGGSGLVGLLYLLGGAFLQGVIADLLAPFEAIAAAGVQYGVSILVGVAALGGALVVAKAGAVAGGAAL